MTVEIMRLDFTTILHFDFEILTLVEFCNLSYTLLSLFCSLSPPKISLTALKSHITRIGTHLNKFYCSLKIPSVGALFMRPECLSALYRIEEMADI